jgi:hypothetical protein
MDRFKGDASVALSSLAAEFVPGASSMLPSIGAQLDSQLGSLRSRCETLAVENKYLFDQLVEFDKNDKIARNRVVALEKTVEDLAGAIIGNVVEKLTSLVGPIVAQILQPALRASLDEMLPTLVGTAVKMIRSDSDVAVGGVEPTGTVTRVEPTACTTSGAAAGHLTWARADITLGSHGSSVGDGGNAGGGKVKTVASSVDLEGDDVKIGDVVGIDGLLNAPSLNGLVGRVLGFDAASGRYMVELENGHGNRRFKRHNLLTEEELDDAEGVEEDESGVSGNGSHDEMNFSRADAGGQSESLRAAPACL